MPRAVPIVVALLALQAALVLRFGAGPDVEDPAPPGSSSPTSKAGPALA